MEGVTVPVDFLIYAGLAIGMGVYMIGWLFRAVKIPFQFLGSR